MLAGRNRGWWPILAAVLVVLVLVISAGWLVQVWVREGATAASSQAAAPAFLLAAALAAATVVRWVRRRRAASASPVTAEQVGQAAATLAEVVAEQWRREVTARSLEDPEPMPVR